MESSSEIYKNTTQKNPEIMWPYFTCNNIAYNVRKGLILSLNSTHSTYYGTNSVYFWGLLIWNNVPRDVKSSKSVSELRTLEILNADVQYVVRLIYTLNLCCEITKVSYKNNYFPSCDKIHPKRYTFLLCFTYIMESTVITILNMTLSAILLFHDFVGVY